MYFEEVIENQWAQLPYKREQNDPTLQWAELTPLQALIPVTTSSPSPSLVFNGGPSFSQQEFANSNNLGGLISNQFMNETNFNFSLPNGVKTNRPPTLPNGNIVRITPLPNPGRFSGWNTNMKNSTTGVRKPKRNRTAFTTSQLNALEEEYRRTNKYLKRERRIELSKILQIHEHVIKVWFQNRRMKEKKDKAEMYMPDEEASSTTGISIVIHDGPLTSDVFGNHVYQQQHPVASTPTMSMAQIAPILQENGYALYNIPEEYGQSQQLHKYGPPPPYPNESVEMLDNSSQIATEAPSAPSITTNTMSSDLSWLNDFNFDVDF